MLKISGLVKRYGDRGAVDGVSFDVSKGETVGLLGPNGDGLDAVTWRGLGFDAAIGPIAVLFGSAALCAVIAAWRFRWSD